MSGGFRGNATYRPDFQRTRLSHANDLALWLSIATDPVFNATTIDQLERRHGGKGGLKRADIESKVAAERLRREARA